MVARKIMLAFLLLVFWACSDKKESIIYPSPPDYDFTNPVMIRLKADLDEISGIVYYPKDTSIFAINDELGVLYKIYIRKQVKIKRWKFSNDGDYEDLVLKDSTFYALQSDGNLKEFQFLSKDSVSVESCTIPLEGHNNFETMYYDSYKDKIILACKDCETDGKNKTSAYSFNPTDKTFIDRPVYTIDTDSINDLLGGNKQKFKPSAAAIHPKSKELYLISSVSKSLVIADNEGKVKRAYPIDPRLFKQPEGLTFTPEGDLIISNESAEIGAANILIFKYKPVINEKG